MHYISPGKLVFSPPGEGVGVAGSGLGPISGLRRPFSPFNHLYLQFARLANL